VSAERRGKQNQTAASQGDAPMKVSLFGVGLLALTSTIGFAQAAPAPAQAPMQRHAATINQRREHQQMRIGEGIRTGRLNARQGARLERREASIGRQERHMRAADGGRLTHFDRVRLNHRLNRTSRAIYRAKHRSMRQ
jgi:hypothetical protein